MPSDAPDPEEIDSLEDVKTLFAAMQQRDDDIESKYKLALGDISALEDEVAHLREQLAERDARIEQLEETLERVNATMPQQQKSKLQKFVDIIHAAENAQQGPTGSTLTYSEVAAACSCSRQHAHTLMDEFGAKFSFASIDAPSGKRKKLRVKFGDRDADDLIEQVEATVADGGASA